MKSKFNSFLDDIVTRPSVAYAAFISYFFLIVLLLCRAMVVFDSFLHNEYVPFFYISFDETSDQGILGILFTTSFPLLVITLFLIFVIPVLIFYLKEKKTNFQLMFKPIFDSLLYRGLLFLGLLLFGVWILTLIFAIPIYIYWLYKFVSYEIFSFISTITILSPFVMVFFIFYYILIHICVFLDLFNHLLGLF